MHLSDLIVINLPSPFVKLAQRRKVQTCTIRIKRFTASEDIVALGGTLMGLSFQELDLQLRSFINSSPCQLFLLNVIMSNYHRKAALNGPCHLCEMKVWV